MTKLPHGLNEAPRDYKLEDTALQIRKIGNSVGVILPASLTNNTGAPEIMECVAGACEYKLAGSSEWKKSGPGEKFSIPGNSSFEIRVADAYHYICHFG